MTRTLKRSETQELLCDLTTEERVSRGIQLGGVIQEIAALEAQKAASAKEYGAQISLAKTRRDKLAEAAKTGKELQPVSCDIYADITRSIYVTVRTDTAEEIDSRVMTTSEVTHERQASLPLEPEPDDTRDVSTQDAVGDDPEGVETPQSAECAGHAPDDPLTLLDQGKPKD